VETAAASSAWVTHPWVAAGHGKVRFAIGITSQEDEWTATRDVVQLAEGLGFDSYWCADHPESWPDCWTTLAALAASTRTIRLGTLVSCVYYHTAAQIARAAADVDRISGGRLILGLGVGDFADEFRALGLPFPSLKERQAALIETIEIIQSLWSERPYTRNGTLNKVVDINFLNGPVQRPRVPLLIGGGGEKVTLKQVARYADMSNFAALSDAGSAFTAVDAARKYAALREHCAAFGRPFDSVVRSFMSGFVVVETRTAAQAKLNSISEGMRSYWRPSTVVGTPEDAIAYFRPLIEAGVNYFICFCPNRDEESIRLLAERVMPELATYGI
jgi:alkanesulfonate monooxygenase SsuD/methylene tetrahydromethanopterin reductase-like flavin-dependent oxidoreductase (luciferase family)